MQIIDIPISKDLQETTVHGNYAFPLAIYEDHLNRNLINSDMTVSQISDCVGFGSVSYYIERFRKQIGVPPKEFQKNLRNSQG
jgi:hypothetical protein